MLMKMIKYISIFFIFSLMFLYGQTITPPEFILSEDVSEEKLSFLLDESSEIKLTALWTIRLYKNFISSQHDHRMCNFIPSCSSFGVDALKHQGIVKGGLLTSDRLQRCNNLDNWKYVKEESTNRMIDPISNYIDDK